MGKKHLWRGGGLIAFTLIIFWIGQGILPFFQASSLTARGDRLIDQAWVQKGNFPCEYGSANPAYQREVLQGIEILKKALEKDPNWHQTYILLARAYCLAGLPSEAVPIYDRYIGQKPVDILAHLELGFAYEAECLGDSEAYQETEISEAYCTDDSRRIQIANSWQEAGIKPEDFVARGRQALAEDDFQAAFLNANRTILLDDRYGEGFILAGEVLTQMQAFQQADLWYQHALELDPTRLDWRMERGRNAMSADNFSLAVEIFQEAIDKFPNFPDAFYELAWVYRQVNQKSEAQSAIDRALALIQSPNPSYYLRAGRIYSWLEETEGAKSFYKEAIISAPNTQIAATAHIELGELLYQTDQDVGGAITEFERAIAISPERGNGYFAIAQLLAAETDYTGADEWYREAIVREPQVDWWQLRRADNARNGGNLDQAIDLYLTTIRNFPEYGLAYHQIAWAYRLKGEPAQAIAAIENAGELLATKGDWYYIRAGQIYQWAGELDQAKSAYEAALAINPNAQAAIEGLKEIAKP